MFPFLTTSLRSTYTAHLALLDLIVLIGSNSSCHKQEVQLSHIGQWEACKRSLNPFRRLPLPHSSLDDGLSLPLMMMKTGILSETQDTNSIFTTDSYSVGLSWSWAPSLVSWPYFKFAARLLRSQRPLTGECIRLLSDALALVNRTTNSCSPEKILLHSVGVKLSYSVNDRVANGDIYNHACLHKIYRFVTMIY
jgi:hypothetical protein